jgi:uncharacterized protein YggE
MLLGLATGALLCAVPSAFSQTVQVSRQNRTVEVSVRQKISVDAEVASVIIGCQEYGPTHDQAYQENLRVADNILRALLKAGIPMESIKSSRLDLSENPSFDPESHAKPILDRRFRAHQSWVVRVEVADAQKIIDLAVQAGANGLESVSWDVKDPEALESKAREAALEKARASAAEIAKTLGAKLGDALYASNSFESLTNLPLRSRSALLFGILDPAAQTTQPRFTLKLFPEKVEKEASVTVVFALD